MGTTIGKPYMGLQTVSDCPIYRFLPIGELRSSKRLESTTNGRIAH